MDSSDGTFAVQNAESVLPPSKRTRTGGWRGHQALRILHSHARVEYIKDYGAVAINGEGEGDADADADADSLSVGITPGDLDLCSPITFSTCSPLSSPTISDVEISPVMPSSDYYPIPAGVADGMHYPCPTIVHANESTPLLPRKLMLAEKYISPSTHPSTDTPTPPLLSRLALACCNLIVLIKRRMRAHRRRSSGTLKPLILPRQVADLDGSDRNILLRMIGRLWQLVWFKTFW